MHVLAPHRLQLASQAAAVGAMLQNSHSSLSITLDTHYGGPPRRPTAAAATHCPTAAVTCCARRSPRVVAVLRVHVRVRDGAARRKKDVRQDEQMEIVTES